MQEKSDTPSVKGKNYADFSRDELIAEINRLKKTKKYGLVWEHKKEEVIENFKAGQQPYLKEVEDKRIENAPGEPTNLIIEGDNFDALSVLNYTHAGKIDVIYIDPPYNTRRDDFTYNDNYVQPDDEYRHSFWLSFMEPRLKLAKNLLTRNGVVFISIDDTEQAPLKMLCDEVFGQDNFVGGLIHQRAKGGGQAKHIVKGHDYILFYAKDINAELPLGKRKIIQGKTVEIDGREYIKNDDVIRKVFGKYNKDDGDRRCFYEELEKYKGLKKKKEIDEKIERGQLFLEENKYGMHTICQYIPVDTAISKIYSILKVLSEDGTNELNEIGINSFSYPKPKEIIKQLIESVSTLNKKATVLDFFAGSGTTGHAVLEFNKEDGGHRQFILCTNNGDKGPDSTKIAEDITYPRIKTVITGKRQDGSKYSDGIPANLRYYKIEHEQKLGSNDANRLSMSKHMEDILQIKENAFKEVKSGKSYKLYKNSEKYLCLALDAFEMEKIIEKITEENKEKLDTVIYSFSYSRDAFEDDYEADFNIEFKAMPEGLLKTYLNITESLRSEE